MFLSNFGPSYFLRHVFLNLRDDWFIAEGYDKCHVGGDHHMGYYFYLITGSSGFS